LCINSHRLSAAKSALATCGIESSNYHASEAGSYEKSKKYVTIVYFCSLSGVL